MIAIVLAVALLAGCGRQPIERVEWPTMGTIAAVQFKGIVDNEVVREVRAKFDLVERLLNAHNPESELSRLAKLSDAEILAKCDPRVRPCYEAAFRLRDLTGGAFDPRWKGAGTMDLGAIAKGFAIDLVRIEGHAMVDLGGNLKAFGESWSVGIKDGDVFELKSGASCATSARYFRGNHIVDGRNHGVVSNGFHSVTVIHPTSAMIADGLSTVVFILGEEKGREFITRYFPEARLFLYSLAR